MHAKSLDRIFQDKPRAASSERAESSSHSTRAGCTIRVALRIRVRALRPAVDAVALWSSGASERGCGGGKKAEWTPRRGEGRGRMTVQRMQRGRQKTMSRGGGQTGGKNTRRAPNPGLSCADSLATYIYICMRTRGHGVCKCK